MSKSCRNEWTHLCESSDLNGFTVPRKGPEHILLASKDFGKVARFCLLASICYFFACNTDWPSCHPVLCPKCHEPALGWALDFQLMSGSSRSAAWIEHFSISESGNLYICKCKYVKNMQIIMQGIKWEVAMERRGGSQPAALWGEALTPLMAPLLSLTPGFKIWLPLAQQTRRKTLPQGIFDPTLWLNGQPPRVPVSPEMMRQNSC